MESVFDNQWKNNESGVLLKMFTYFVYVFWDSKVVYFGQSKKF